MDKEGRIILVTGATGKQGGAVARELLKNGWRVRLLCRNPGKPEARELAALGAQAVRGDLDDRGSVVSALKGCHGVFSVQSHLEQGPEGEVRQGVGLAEEARSAKVKHLVYASVASADHETGIPHFESKWSIEQHIRKLKLPATIIRPVWFMDNFATVYRQSILGGVLRLPLRPDKPLQMIAVTDIGRVAAVSFAHPDDFVGKAMDIAGDELTMPHAVELLARAMGRAVRYEAQPVEEVRPANPDLAAMFQWLNEIGFSVDIPALRKRFPEMMLFESWVRWTGWQRMRDEAASASHMTGR